MKWLIGLLLAANIFVFVLANMSDSESSSINPELFEPPKGVQPIKLHASTLVRASGNCSNVGPIKQQIVLKRFEQLLVQRNIDYKVVLDQQREVAAYRVIIPANQIKDMTELKTQLAAVGVEEIYEKRNDQGESYLSLGLFTYKKTAEEFAHNLSNSGIGADYRNETLTYPERYWLNVSGSLSEGIMTEFNQFSGSIQVNQMPTRCL